VFEDLGGLCDWNGTEAVLFGQKEEVSKGPGAANVTTASWLQRIMWVGQRYVACCECLDWSVGGMEGQRLLFPTKTTTTIYRPTKLFTLPVN
jgi:hypothetical protein